MLTRVSSNILCLCLALVVLSQAHISWAHAEEMLHGRLAGKVVDKDGNPISNARVFIDGNRVDASTAQALTDSSGDFVIATQVAQSAAHRGLFQLLIDAPDFAPFYIDGNQITIFEGTTKDLGTLILDRGFVYTGRVVDTGGKPIPNATVQTSLSRYSRGNMITFPNVERVVAASTDGRFVTQPVSYGFENIDVFAPEHQRKWISSPIAESSRGNGQLPDTVLEPDISFEGTLVDQEGNPVAGGEVSLSGNEPTRSDANGKFKVDGLRPNAFCPIVVTKTGYGRAMWDISRKDDTYLVSDYRQLSRYKEIADPKEQFEHFHADAQSMPGLKLTLHNASHIRGRVFDAKTSQPLQISQVIMCNFKRDKSGKVTLYGCTNPYFHQPKRGEFEIEYNHAEQYHLWIKSPGYHDAEAFVNAMVLGQDVDNIDVAMQSVGLNTPTELPQINGTVIDPDGVATHARVGLVLGEKDIAAPRAALQRGRSVEYFRVETSVPVIDGKFTLTAPEAGNDWYLLLESPTGPLATHGPISLAVGDNPAITLTASKLGSLQGHVANIKNFKSPMWAVMFNDQGLVYETQVHADGHYQFDNILPGQYGLKIACEEFRDTEVPNTRFMSQQERDEAYKLKSDPWKRARIVSVVADQSTDAGELEFTP